MKLNVRSMAIALGLLWGCAIFLISSANLIWSGYGQAFLEVMASVYPGYTGAAGFGDVIIATLSGLLDGALGGAILAWLYNRFAG